MIIYLASDHAGFKLKEKIKKFLAVRGYKVKDLGPFSYKEGDDYPDLIKPAAQKISKNSNDKAIIFGGSGQGEAMAANRYKNVRATVYYGGPIKIIRLSREHNDANVLSLGARFVTAQEAFRAVELWLKTPFSKEARHERRIKKLS